MLLSMLSMMLLSMNEDAFCLRPYKSTKKRWKGRIISVSFRMAD